jgi:hypothetical protein
MPHQKRLEAAAVQAVRQRNYKRARDRALTRLSRAFPEQYKELLEREKLNDEILGKKWADLDGNPAPITITIVASESSQPEWETSNQGTEREGDSE